MAIIGNRFRIRNISGIINNKLRKLKLYKLIGSTTAVVFVALLCFNYRSFSKAALNTTGLFVLNGQRFYNLAGEYIRHLKADLSLPAATEKSYVASGDNSQKTKFLEEKLVNLELENAHLKYVLKFVEHLGIPYITTRLLSTSVTPYGHIGIINAGSVDGLMKDQIVSAGDIIVGRVLEISELFAQVLLLNDFRMKVSVVSSRTQQRCIVAGNNSAKLQVKCDGNNEELQLGDILITAGDSQYYPPGLLVAQISQTGADLEAIPLADLSSINIVNVISYHNSLPAK